MKPAQVNRWKELLCVLFGHEFTESRYEKETDTDFILEESHTCQQCQLSTIDISGRLYRYRQQHPEITAFEAGA